MFAQYTLCELFFINVVDIRVKNMAKYAIFDP